MKEQKLFFTRNGEYSLWEMLGCLTTELFEDLYDFTIGKGWVNTYPANHEFPSFFYRCYLRIEPTNQIILESKVKEYFMQVPEPKSEFNAIMYNFYGAFDLNSAMQNLNELISKSYEFGIEGLKVSLFSYESINGNRNVIDVRFTSDKSLLYKENENTQTLHTEIRIYLEIGLAMVTNYSHFTHTESEKSEFLNRVINSVSSFRSRIVPLGLSDQALRELLLLDKGNLPSKLKFDVEGRMKVGIDIKQDAGLDNIIQQDEVMYFYDRFPLSFVKVKIAEGKFLGVDGKEGKLITRTQNLEVQDIDEFVDRLSVLIKFDYLNDDCMKDIRYKASIHLTAVSTQKEQIVKSSYKEVGNIIREFTKDDTNVFNKLLVNSFFYCINQRVFIVEDEKLSLNYSDKSMSYLAVIAQTKPIQIKELLNALLVHYKKNSTNFRNLLMEIDKVINDYKRAIQNASGL
jgi:hypothetical protein